MEQQPPAPTLVNAWWGLDGAAALHECTRDDVDDVDEVVEEEEDVEQLDLVLTHCGLSSRRRGRCGDSQRSHFERALLDSECLAVVARFLRLRDLVRLTQVNRALYHHLRNRAWLWASLAIFWRVPVSPTRASPQTIGALHRTRQLQVVTVALVEHQLLLPRKLPKTRAFALAINVDGVAIGPSSISRQAGQRGRQDDVPRLQRRLSRYEVPEQYRFSRLRSWNLDKTNSVLEINTPDGAVYVHDTPERLAHAFCVLNVYAELAIIMHSNAHVIA
jgi:hypothetical protein